MPEPLRQFYASHGDNARAALGGKNMTRDESILAVGIAEAARRLGLSVRTVATLVARGELFSRKVGRRRLVPVEALETFIGHSLAKGHEGRGGV